MKRTICFLLTLFLFLPVLLLPVSAAEGNPEFRYELSVDGKDTVEVNTGDIITVTLYLHRSDAQETYTMHAMQSEIRYDSTFLELVPGSELLSNGIESTDIAMVDHHREFYMNFVAFSAGETWEPKTRIGSFQLKVTGESGVTKITNEDFLVSLKDGSGSYKCQANELTVILSTDCTVKFETNGGTPIEPVQAIYGETIARPEDPVREGKVLVGWFKDIHLNEEWNFETDTVAGNMTLYAKWADAPAEEIVEGDSCIICGGERFCILSICWLCWLIVILLVLAGGVIIFRKKSKKKGKTDN